jgi:hypothetical protein
VSALRRGLKEVGYIAPAAIPWLLPRNGLFDPGRGAPT